MNHRFIYYIDTYNNAAKDFKSNLESILDIKIPDMKSWNVTTELYDFGDSIDISIWSDKMCYEDSMGEKIINDIHFQIDITNQIIEETICLDNALYSEERRKIVKDEIIYFMGFSKEEEEEDEAYERMMEEEEDEAYERMMEEEEDEAYERMMEEEEDEAYERMMEEEEDEAYERMMEEEGIQGVKGPRILVIR